MMDFNVDVNQSQLTTQATVVTTSGHPRKLALRLNLRIKFQNRDVHPLIVNDVILSLRKQVIWRISNEVQLEHFHTRIIQLPQAQRLNSNHVTVQGRSNSPDYCYEMLYALPQGVDLVLDNRYFLRIQMNAMNQQPLHVDVDVLDWRAVLQQAISGVSPAPLRFLRPRHPRNKEGRLFKKKYRLSS